ncbi:ATP-binding protein [Methanomethylovorans sp.]|uniref:ATP-binding protein n=1 Tax=Methanomethylovorans sp. TaxID=2758717 RepID=UPI00351C1FB4
MNTEILIALTNNAALLLALAVLYDVLFSSMEVNTRLKSVAAGVIIGLIGIALMLNPWELSPGLFFDTRSILLSTVSLYFGFYPAVIGALIIGSYRFYEGGVGVATGISVTACSVILGLLWRQSHQRFQRLFGRSDLYVFGLLVHIVMLLCMLLLPWPFSMEVLSRITLPVMLIYPIGTVLLGSLLNNQLSRKRTQDALKENEAKLQSFIDNVPVGIFRATSDGKMIRSNPEMSRIAGLNTPEQAISSSKDLGKELYIDHRTSKELLKALKTQGYVENFEYETLRADGKHIWLLVNARMTGEREEDTFTIDGFVLDITERKKAEEQMLLARIAAEDANRFKSELLANMNHELRTPLNSIIGFSDILMEGTFGEITEEQKKYVRIIYQSGRSLLTLVDRVLALSEIESGSLELKSEMLDIRNAIEEVKESTGFLSSRKDISVDINLDEHIPQINADANKFRGIFYNLIENSIKFTPEGGRVEIRSMTNNGNIEISVIDNGIGIADCDMRRVFDPFIQIDGSNTRKYRGAGLGLTLVKEYVKMHGGTLRVESEPGKGSIFTVSLPTAVTVPHGISSKA